MAIYRGPGGTGDSSRGDNVFGPNTTIESLTGLIGPIRTPTYIEFNKTANHTPIAGQLTWNEQEGTLDVGLNAGSVVLQLGEEVLYRVHNGSGVVIPDGTLVMATGTLGNSGRIVVAAYDGVASPERIMGLATDEIPIGEEGYVTHFGKVRGIQTNGGNYGESWADGDIIYASSTGGLTKTRPEAPNTKTIIALVIKAHGSNGTLFVRVTQSSALSNDDLVELGTLSNGDILVYNDSTNRFENVANTAVQPNDLGAVAYSNDYNDLDNLPALGSAAFAETTDFATSAQGGLADSAIQPGDNVSELTNDAGYLDTETDPVYTGSSWYTTTNNSSDWDTAYSWGNHASVGYLTSESDPIFVASDAYNITATDISNWNDAYSWGDHATAGYYLASNPDGYTSNTGTVTSVDMSVPTGLSVSGNPITTSGTLAVTFSSGYSIPTTSSQSNWDTAYGWGNHASAGYLTSAAIGSTVLAYDSNLQSFVNTFTLPTTDGTIGQVLTTNGSGTLSFSSAAGAGTVTSVDITAGTGISATGGPITSSGSITVTNTAPMVYPGAGIPVSTGSAWGTSKTSPAGEIVGTTDSQTLTNKTINGSNNTITNVSLSTGVTGTLPVANGGTGATSLTANNVLLGNGTSALQVVAPGTTGNLLTSNGTTWTSTAPPAGGQYLGTATTKAIMFNAQSIAENITVGATQNAGSFGPITIDDTYTVTVDSGGTWTIV